MEFDKEEIGDLLLSVCRSNDFNVILKEENKWISEKLIPNTIIVNLDNEDIVKLLVFSLEITYQMFEGGTRATVNQKGFRERRRTFETILVDQFTGKLGEIFVKRFLEKNFNVNVMLDWEISQKIQQYRLV